VNPRPAAMPHAVGAYTPMRHNTGSRGGGRRRTTAPTLFAERLKHLLVELPPFTFLLFGFWKAFERFRFLENFLYISTFFQS